MRSLYASILVATLVAVALPATARAQWKEIGKTSSNNPVSIIPSSVKTDKDGIITARVQVRFVEPVKTPKGAWRMSRHVMMFDCARQTVAAKATYYYSDLAAQHEVERSIPGKPGFGSPIGGSMTRVALDYICANKPKK